MESAQPSGDVSSVSVGDYGRKYNASGKISVEPTDMMSKEEYAKYFGVAQDKENASDEKKFETKPEKENKKTEPTEDDEEEELIVESKNEQNELKRLKNSVPALQRKTSELLKQNKELQSEISKFSEYAKDVAKKSAENVWKSIVENFDEIQDEILKQRGLDPDEYIRDKFLKKVEYETMDDDKRRLYDEKRKLEKENRELMMYRKSLEEKQNNENMLLEQQERVKSISSTATMLGKIAKEVGLPENDPSAIGDLLDSLIIAAEKAEIDPAFSRLTDRDIAQMYADRRVNSFASAAKDITWEKIKSMPQSKELLAKFQQVLSDAGKNSAHVVKRRAGNNFSGTNGFSKNNNKSGFITESQMYAEMRKGLGG